MHVKNMFLTVQLAAVYVGLARRYGEVGEWGKREEVLRALYELGPDGREGRVALRELGLGEAERLEREGKVEEALAAYRRVLKVVPERVELWRRVGELALRRRAYGEAVEAFRKVLEGRPKDAPALVGLGEAYLGLGKAREAVEALERAAEAGARGRRVAALLDRAYGLWARKLAAEVDDPERRQEAVRLAKDWIIRRRLDPAQRVLEAALRADPEDARAHYLLGLIWDGRRQFRKALAEVERSLELAPDNLRLRMEYARILVRADRLEEAEREYRRVLAEAEDPEMRAKAERLLGLVAGQRLLDAGRLEEAEREYRRLVAKYPGDVLLRDRLVDLYLGQGRLEEAEAVVRAGLEALPEDPHLHLRLADIFARQGLRTAEREALAEALRLDPTGESGRRAAERLGLAEARRAAAAGDWARAEAAYRSLLAVAPDFPEGVRGLADVLLRQGKAKEAVPILEDYTGKRPGDGEARLLLARAWYRAGQVKRATDLLKRLRGSEDPELARRARDALAGIYQALARELLKAGKMEEAERGLLAALREDPEDTQAMAVLATVYERRKEPDKALKVLDRLLQLEPTRQAAWALRGNLLLQQGRTDQAVEAFLRVIALERDPRQTAAQVKAVRRLVLLKRLRSGETAWARRELELLVQAYPREAAFWGMLGGVYRQLDEPRKAIQAYKRALALNPKDVQSRYSLALLYEQENEDRLALRQYEIIATSEIRSPLVSAAEQRRRVVERRLKLFVGRLGYSMALGTVEVGGQRDDQFRTSLAFSLSSAFRPTKRSNLTFSLTPTYVGIHDSQTDSLSMAASANGGYNRGRWGLFGSYRFARQMGLLVEQFRGTTVNGSLGIRYNGRVPGFLLASGEASPLIFQAAVSANDFRPAQVSFFGTKGRNLRLGATLPLRGGRLVTAGLVFGRVRNKHPLGTDYAYDARVHNLGLNLPLTRRIRLTAQASYESRDYLHPDSNARYGLGRIVRRRSTVLGAGLGLNVRLTRDLHLNAGYSWSGTRSNLPVGFVYMETPAGPRPVAVQAATLGSFTSQSLSVGIIFDL